MTSDEAEDLLAYGIAAAKSNDREEARYYLEWVLRTDADFDQQVEAWYWLSTITDDPAEKRSCLENVLAINPRYGDARRDLAILDGRLEPAQLIDPRYEVRPVRPDGHVDLNDIQAFKCPKCGARLSADKVTGELSCGFCGYRSPAPAAAGGGKSVGSVKEQNWDATIFAAKGHRWEVPTSRTFACESCGANVLVPAGQVSTICPFCGTPHVIHAEAERELIEPGGVMPFRLSAQDAFAAISRWLGAQHFAPRDLASASTQSTPRPVYLPFWTFDLEGVVRWTGTTPSVEFGRPEMREVNGEAPLLLSDVLAPGTKSIPAGILESLHFDMHLLVPYSPDALANWPAEVYSISPADASLDARDIAMRQARSGNSTQSGLSVGALVENLRVVSTDLSILSYKLALLPVWISSYAYERTTFQVVANGNTGEVEGNVPRNAWQSMLTRLLRE